MAVSLSFGAPEESNGEGRGPDAPEEQTDEVSAQAELGKEEETESDASAGTEAVTPDRYSRMPGRVNESSPHYDLEVLYSELKFDEVTRICRERLQTSPDDLTLHWMLIRALYERGEEFPRTDEKIDKKAIYQEMIDLSEHGLSLSPDDPHMLFARGLALGRMGTHRGVLASLFSVSEIEEVWVKSAVSGYEYASLYGNEQMPCDVYLGLGVFYRLVPDWWIVKLIAGTRGSLPKSIDWLERANQCAPDTIRLRKELGVSYMCQGHKTNDSALIEKGKETIRSYFNLEAKKPTEVTDMKHGRWLLENTEAACEYSRDGQQDLDRSKLENP